MAKVNESREPISGRSIANFQRGLLAWYDVQGREFPWRTEGATVYSKVLVEVLLQRTTASAAANFLPKFRKRYPSWMRLAAASLSELQRELKPLGLWRRRARS